MNDYHVLSADSGELLGESNDLRTAQLLSEFYPGSRVEYIGRERRLPKTKYAKLRVELLERR